MENQTVRKVFDVTINVMCLILVLVLLKAYIDDSCPSQRKINACNAVDGETFAIVNLSTKPNGQIRTAELKIENPGMGDYVMNFKQNGEVVSTRYDKKGNPSFETKRKGDKDISRAWYANGQIRSETVTIGNASFWKAWHSNGNLNFYIEMLGEDYHGKKQNFYQNGQIWMDEEYSEGTPVGKWKWYFENGTLQAYYEFDNNGNRLCWKHWRETGELVYEEYIEPGNEHGLSVVWASDDVIKRASWKLYGRDTTKEFFRQHKDDLYRKWVSDTLAKALER